MDLMDDDEEICRGPAVLIEVPAARLRIRRNLLSVISLLLNLRHLCQWIGSSPEVQVMITELIELVDLFTNPVDDSSSTSHENPTSETESENTDAESL